MLIASVILGCQIYHASSHGVTCARVRQALIACKGSASLGLGSTKYDSSNAVSTDVTAEVALALRRRVDHFLDDEEPDDGGRVAVQLELERPAPGVAVRAAGLQVREAEKRPDVVPEGAPAGERRRVPGLAEGLEPEQHLAALPAPRAPQADHHRRRRLISRHVVAGRQRS